MMFYSANPTPDEIVIEALGLIKTGIVSHKILNKFEGKLFHFRVESRKSGNADFYCFAENVTDAKKQFEEEAPGIVYWDYEYTCTGPYYESYCNLLVDTAGLSHTNTIEDRLEDIISEICDEGLPRRSGHLIFINEIPFSEFNQFMWD
jgi:hypothetical protein